MDWKNITNSLIPYLDRAKQYGMKAAKFAEQQIQTTPLFIKTQSDYENLITEKRVVILAYDEAQENIAHEIRLFSSIWLTRAFMDTTKLRFIAIGESIELVQNIGITTSIDMRVRYEGVETFHFRDLSDIKKWWQSPLYMPGDTSDTVKTEPVSDPLAGK